MNKPVYKISFEPNGHWWWRWHYRVNDGNYNEIVWGYSRTKGQARRAAKRSVWWNTRSWFKRRECNEPYSTEIL